MAVDVGVEDADALRPSCENATARFAVSDDLPTPPLPLATAITRQSRGRRITLSRSGAPPRSFVVSACRSSGRHDAEREREAAHAGHVGERLVDLLLEESRSGQPAIVSTIVSETTPSALETSRTMSSSVTGRCSSGSMTAVECAENGVAVGFHRHPSLAKGCELPRRGAQRSRLLQHREVEVAVLLHPLERHLPS